jgi:glycogen operon protein
MAGGVSSRRSAEHSHRVATSRGRPWPLGATPDAHGTNFAVVSTRAERIELCLFDPTGTRETARVELAERTDDVFHRYLEGIRPGQLYGLRAHGPWRPREGLRFNPNALLLDPWAKALAGRFVHDPEVPPADDDLRLDPRDTAAFRPKAVVAAAPDPAPRLGAASPAPLIYEAHIKGLTRLHPDIPEAWRGTYRALAAPVLIDHLVRLGVTAVELLPTAAFLDEPRLVRAGLVNYWGYNPMALMAAEPRYATGDPWAELGLAVRALHGAGIEVILDVVLNHTAESDEHGPTISFRGLDNPLWYRLDPDEPRRYRNHAGTGNCLNLAEPRVLQLALDTLRHWATLGIDGFRFDLATVLGRDRDDRFDPQAAFFQAIAQDPVLGSLTLIAEPWDIGPDGYQAGRFPRPFAEWNDRFRDTVRRFWRGDEGITPELATRLLGSADRYRRPAASINYVTSHDGFTLADLVSFARKHNLANLEDNRDGHHDELSSNAGVEGESDDPDVRALRLARRRAMLATVMLAQGTPMLQMGDELGRSQGGNNNAYCQDNTTSWMRWQGISREDASLVGFVAGLARLRRAHPALRRERFLHGDPALDGSPDAAWLRLDGAPMTTADWADPARRAIALRLGPLAHDEQALLVVVNAGTTPQVLSLPDGRWTLLLDSTAEDPFAQRQVVGVVSMPAIAVWLLALGGERGVDL